jgi:predicted transcriptional regulator with HTH domain
VPDGNLLIANIYISEHLRVSNSDPSKWKGYKLGDKLGDGYGESLLSYSSPLPESYREAFKIYEFNIQPGTVMMYPGKSIEFIKKAFISVGSSSAVIKRRQDRSGLKHDI